MKKYQIDDSLFVDEYKRVGNCKLVAQKFGCSDETVRRALIRLNVPRTNKNPKPRLFFKITEDEKRLIVEEYYNSNLSMCDLAKKYKRSQETISQAIKEYGNGIKYCKWNSKKITDEQLIEESKTLTLFEIAKKYDISLENLWKRAKKCKVDFSGQGSVGRWYYRAKRYGCEFDPSISLNKLRVRDKDICQICGELVDDKDFIGKHIGKRYPTLDHIIPLSKGGTHSWRNIQLAHMGCNSRKGVKLDNTVKRKEVRP